MLYCYHCGKKIDNYKLEAKAASLNSEEVNDDTKVEYICPRCGHLTHLDATESDKKELSIACHSQVQRGNNHFALGMSFNSVGIILLAIAIIFYVLAHKPAGGFVRTCGEYYVFVALLAISVILLGFGIAHTIVGIVKKVRYSRLLKDLNNGTFVQ